MIDLHKLFKTGKSSESTTPEADEILAAGNEIGTALQELAIGLAEKRFAGDPKINMKASMAIMAGVILHFRSMEMSVVENGGEDSAPGVAWDRLQKIITRDNMRTTEKVAIGGDKK